MANVEIDESFAQMEEDQQRIRRLSDLEAATDSGNDDSLEGEGTDCEDSDEVSEAERAESLAGDETEQLKRASKVSFGLNSIQVQLLTVTPREKKRLSRS